MAGGESRGREKAISSPNGEQRKKKGSLFRRASLSRKKNKEEARQRSKSKERHNVTTEPPSTDERDSTEKKKTKSASLPRDLKSPFGRPSSKSKTAKDLSRRRTLDLDNMVHIRSLSECVARSGGAEVDIPGTVLELLSNVKTYNKIISNSSKEIVKALICEVEDRGLDVPSVYQKSGPKSSIREIIKSYDQLEETNLSEVSIHVICSALREFMTSLPGNVLAGIAVDLEQSILKPETFTETAKKLIETQLPKQNKALCAWIFNHVSHLIEHYDNNKLTGRPFT